ncbi:MAG: hypothetical protein KF809_14945 [Chloroflexi bacterium]|nr:hypothetical protein [Chloroflexota bacterium]
MTWGRVDDGHYDHQKVLALPRRLRNAADGLYWRAISRCNRTLSDGLLSAGDLELVDAEPELVEALIEVGLFDRDRRGRVWVHDFLDFNKSKEEVLEEREKKAAAGRAGGLASGRARTKRTPNQKPTTRRNGASSKREAPASSVVEPPSRPVPSEDSLGVPGLRPTEPGARLAAGTTRKGR